MNSVRLLAVPINVKHLARRRFVSSYDVKSASKEALPDIAKNGFQQLNERWHKYIVNQDDYFEGCASVL